MFNFGKKKSSAKADVKSLSVGEASQTAYLAHVERPQPQTKTFYVNKTVPAVTYSTQYNVTTYAPEKFTYIKPGKTVTEPVQNLVTVHDASKQIRESEYGRGSPVTAVVRPSPVVVSPHLPYVRSLPALLPHHHRCHQQSDQPMVLAAGHNHMRLHYHCSGSHLRSYPRCYSSHPSTHGCPNHVAHCHCHAN